MERESEKKLINSPVDLTNAEQESFPPTNSRRWLTSLHVRLFGSDEFYSHLHQCILFNFFFSFHFLLHFDDSPFSLTISLYSHVDEVEVAQSLCDSNEASHCFEVKEQIEISSNFGWIKGKKNEIESTEFVRKIFHKNSVQGDGKTSKYSWEID